MVGAQRQSSVLAKREAALAAPRNDYDPLYASRWWHILLGVTRVLERYRTPFVGKSSPVQSGGARSTLRPRAGSR